jgi:hypothetical protein
VNETSSTTVRPPYCLVSPLTVIIETSVGSSGVRDESAGQRHLAASAGGLGKRSPDGAIPSSES